MKRTNITLTVGLTALVTVSALALPPFGKDFAGVYKVAKGSTLGKAECAVCHIGKTPKLNPYGQDLKKAMADAKTKKLTADVLKAVEGLDSDKDGAKNGEEIKADSLPGDAKSKPKK